MRRRQPTVTMIANDYDFVLDMTGDHSHGVPYRNDPVVD